jgi:hypothetical protein
LLCIEVDNVNWSTVNWTYSGGNIDVQASFSEDCNNACSTTAGIEELSLTKKVIRVTDLLGRETNVNSNTLLIYYFDNGTFEKVFITE